MLTRRAMLGTVAGAMPALSQANRPPNILFILADDLGADAIGPYGNTQHRTPHLDRMAKESVRFETCYATPLCSPSRVELMTGRYGFRTGFTNFIGRVTTKVDRVSADEITFADVLKQRGYRTGLSGKWQLGLIQDHPTMIHDNGFDEYFSWAWKEGGLPKGAPYDGDPHNRYWHPAIIENGKYVPVTKDQYGPDLYSDWIVRFMEKNRARPFLAYYPMCLVHEPWEPTPDLEQKGKRTAGGLKNNVEYMDHVVGKLFAALDRLGLRENTIVFFTGDNGTGKDGKGTVSERGVRVPMMVSGPGLQRGVVSRDLIDFSDVMPTLAELAGAGLPKGVTVDGRSFAPQLRGEKGNPREWVFSYLAYERMLRDKRWLLEGDGKFYDCGESRDGSKYKEVTGSSDPVVKQARARFEKTLASLPAPQRS